MAFLPIFDKKSLLSFPYFVKINVYFLENKRLSCPYLVKKRQFFQKHGALISFLYNILQKTPAVMPIFGQKTSILSKLHNIMGQKKLIGCTFFSDFHEKIDAPIPIFCQKNVRSQKNTMLSCLYILKKRPFYQKQSRLMSFFRINH